MLEKINVKADLVADAAVPVTPVTPHNDYGDEYWQKTYEERAAIIEYDSVLSCSEAERQAKQLGEEIQRTKSLR